MMTKEESAQLAVIAEGVERLEKRLFGNGQPGEIERLHCRISAQKERIDRLEAWKWRMAGAIAVVLWLADRAVGGVERLSGYLR